MAKYPSTSFYRNIELQYGTEIKQILKSYAKTTYKIGNLISRKSFLIRCRKRGVYPAHIANNFKFVFSLMEENSPYIKKLSKCINRFKKAVLNIEIQQTFFKLKLLEKQKINLKLKIYSSNIATEISTSFLEHQNRFYDKHILTKSKTTKKKFNNII